MDEDIKFLKELQEEIKTQDHDCQAEPRFWTVGDYKWIPTWEDQAESFSICMPDGEGGSTIEEFIDYVQEDNPYDLSEETLNELDERDSDYCEDILDWAQQHVDSEAYLVPEAKVHIIHPNTMFLTKAEAKRHIELNHYHYSSEAHTYAMTAWRAPKSSKAIKHS